MEHIALVVDDDSHTLFFMEQLLRPVGVTVFTASDGVEALELLQNMTPTILFLDLLLPRVNGLDVLNFVVETPRLNNTFVAIVTAHTRSQFAQSPQLGRANAYFVKPVRPQDIRATVKQVIASAG